jgi:hypothetical protein
MNQTELNLLIELSESTARIEQKLDSHIAARPCEKNSGRITALEQKFWVASGMIVVIGSVTGYILSKLPILQILAGGVP